MTDFEPYRVDPSVPLMPDFFVPDDSAPTQDILAEIMHMPTQSSREKQDTQPHDRHSQGR